MANFKGHQAAAITVSIVGTLTCAAYAAQAGATIEPLGFIAIAVAGYIGGLLPDIDHAQSIPNRTAKNFSYLLVVAAIVWHLNGLVGQQLTLLNTLPAIFGVGLVWLFWHIADWIFEHRNHTHSLYAAGCFSIFIGALVSRFLDVDTGLYAGLVCAASYTCHLILDDIYSGAKAKLKGYRAPKKALVVFAKGSHLEFGLVSLFGIAGVLL